MYSLNDLVFTVLEKKMLCFRREYKFVIIYYYFVVVNIGKIVPFWFEKNKYDSVFFYLRVIFFLKENDC